VGILVFRTCKNCWWQTFFAT